MTAKTTNLLYWIFTILFVGLMGMTAIQNLLNTPESIQLIHDQLGYPKYFIPYIGFAKLMGCIALLIPGLDKIKEWAYAGLFFDLVSSIYSGIAAFGFDPMMLLMLGWILPGVLSYYYWNKKKKVHD
jgi:hypothetical protein